MRPTPAPPRLKIIVQYRTKRGKVYEIETPTALISLHISQELESAEGSPWHAEARSVREPEPRAVDGWGPTRAEALADVARAWGAEGALVTPFDWDDATRALRTVQAI